MILVTGPPSSGTTFWIGLLGLCGIDIGFTESDIKLNERGLEQWNANVAAIKRPAYQARKVAEIAETAEKFGIEFEFVFLCHRDTIENSARSSRDYFANQRGKPYPSEEEVVKDSLEFFATMVNHCTKKGIPFTMVEFPRTATDPDYAYETITKCLKIERTTFDRAWKAHADPTKVHVRGKDGRSIE
jgi:hypothetical protein